MVASSARMKFVVGFLSISACVVATFSSSTQSSNFINGVTGGATQTAALQKETSPLAQADDVREEEEMIYITKRDGRVEPLDGKKVRLMFYIRISTTRMVLTAYPSTRS